MITRKEAIALYGSVVALAEALGYASRHAVYMWPKAGPIPNEPYMRLRYQLKPEAFDAEGNLIRTPQAADRPEPVRRPTAAPEPGDAAEATPTVPMKKVA